MATTGTGGYLLSGIKLHVHLERKQAVGQTEPILGSAAVKPPATKSAAELAHVPSIADVVEPAAKKAKTEGFMTQRPAAMEQPDGLQSASSMDDTAQPSERAAQVAADA
jgi:hypothetical protein